MAHERPLAHAGWHGACLFEFIMRTAPKFRRATPIRRFAPALASFASFASFALFASLAALALMPLRAAAEVSDPQDAAQLEALAK